MNRLTALLASLSGLAMTTTTALGQTKPSPEKDTLAEPVQRDTQKGSSVVIRQSGSGNRAVVHQSASGTTTETMQRTSGSNVVTIHHDGHTTVVVDQAAAPDMRKERPESPKDPQKKQ